MSTLATLPTLPNRPTRPTRPTPGPGIRSAMALVVLGLASFLAGCASTTPPAPTLDEVRDMQTRTLPMDADQAFDQVVGTLQDFSFNIDTAERESGLIVATRESEIDLARISRDQKPEEKKDLPVWAKAALVVTGVAVLVAVVAVVSHDDDDECTCEGQDRGRPCPKHRPDHGRGHGRGHDRDHDRDRHWDDHGHDHGPDVVVVHEADGPSGPSIYRYQITVNLKPIDEADTMIRVSGQGRRSRAGVVEEAGPIHDQEFFGRLFARLEDRACVEPPAAAPSR